MKREKKPENKTSKRFSFKAKNSKGAKVFGTGEGVRSPIQAGCIVPITANGNATDVLYFCNRYALEKVNALIGRIDRETNPEVKNRKDGEYLRGMMRGAFLNEVISIRDYLGRIDMNLTAVFRDMLDLRMKQGEKELTESAYPHYRPRK